MKKQLLQTLLVLLVAPFSLLAQTSYACGEIFYDSGGPNGNYGNDESSFAVINPINIGEQVILTLSDVFIEAGDVLTIYNGPSPNFPVLATITQVSGEQYSFTSSDSSGSLSYSFSSNASGTTTGWIGAVECMPSLCLPPNQINTNTIAQGQINFTWNATPGSATQWEVLILPNGGSPQPNSQGVLVTSPYYNTNLAAGTYVMYIRSVCTIAVSDWSNPVTFVINGSTTCELPTNFLVSTITSTSASFGWTAQGTALQWEVVVLPQSAGLPTANTTGTVISLSPFQASGLTPNTQYNFFIRSLCSNSTSAWSAGTYFQTTQSPVVAPTCGESFVDNGGANANYANNSNNTYVICPSTSGQVVTVTFTGFDVEATWDGLYVYNGNSINAPQISSGNNGNSIPGGLPGAFWGTTIPGPFSSTSSDGCLTFRFVSDNVVTRSGWIANVTCAAAPTCSAPTAVTVTGITNSTAQVNWINNASNTTQWEVVAVPCTLTAPTPNFPTTLVTTNPFTLTDLTASTCYKIFVRAVCSSTDASAWTVSSNFTTLNAPAICGGVFTDTGEPNANYANNTDSTTTICPTNAGETVTVTFTSFATETNWDALYVFDGNSITAPMIMSANPAGNVPGGVPGGFWGTLTGTNLPEFTSSAPDGCLTFRFRSDGSVVAAGWTANITCGPAPTCIRPNSLVASSITATSITIGWTAASPNDTQWEVFVLPCGSPTPTTSSTGGILTTTNPIVVNGLMPNTCYDFFVRTICSSTDISTCNFLPNISTPMVPPACGGTFTDTGGPNTNYPNNSNQTYVICPTNPGEIVTVTFTAFAIESNNDGLYVYNGNSATAPMIASANPPGNVPGGLAGGYWGTTTPGPFTSSSPDGCLTFVFRSGTTTTAAGWTANVTCAQDAPKILVIAFVDSNTNGVQDTGESTFPFGNFVVQQNNSGSDMMVYAPTGMYSIYDTNSNNTYDISYQILPEFQLYFSSNGFSVNDVNIPTNSGSQIFYFPISSLQNYSDVEVSLSPYGAPPRPGLTYTQRLTIRNNGGTTASGTLTYIRPTLVTGVTVNPTGAVTNANGFTYNYTNLQPNQNITLYLTLTVPPTPTVNLNNLLTATATLTVANDIYTANNSASLSQIVVNSWDPNDKMEAHGDKIPFSAFTPDDYLFYTIRFQNMGTANAIDVRIEDDLSPLIDEESIRMVNSSHNYVMTREGNHIEWKFENIQLVPEIVSPQASQGFVTFRVKLNPGFQVGTLVPNNASIYFDTNPAIVTNTWNTKFTAPLGLNGQEHLAFVMYPNPAENELTFSANDSGELLQDITIYDLVGKTVKSVRQINTGQTTISIQDISRGVYLVELTSQSGLQLTQKLIIR